MKLCSYRHAGLDCYGVMTDDGIIDLSSELRMLLLLLTVLAFLVYVFAKKIGLKQAVLLLSLYAIFSIYVIARGLESEFAAKIAKILQDTVNTLNIFN